MGFLEQIYDKGYYPSEDVQPEPSEEYTQAKQRVMELTDTIIQQLGDGGEELFDTFLSAKADQVSIELSTAFAEGARFAGKVFVDCCRK